MPAKLESTRRGWALYARNEMLSLAWLTLFKAALDELDGHPKPFRNVEELAAWLITQEALNYRPSAPFDGLVSEDLVQGPAQEQREHPAHELAYWGLLVRKNQPPVETAVRLLVRLVARCLDEEGNSYRDVALAPDTVASYPLNLNSLRRLARTEWSGQDAERWIRTLVSQALATHQRIAIRKMGQSGEDTLMFRSGDLGFFVHRRLEQIVETQPRLRQALQIQRDLGLTVWPPGRFPTLTDLGRRWLAEST